MPLEHFEVRFKNRDGKMIRREIRYPNGYEDGNGPVLNLSSMGDERVSSFDEIPNFYEIAPYLREFSIRSPISGNIDLSIFKKIHKLSFHSSHCEIEGLGKLKHLEWLNLSNTRFKKIEGLDQLKNLRRLILSNANLDKIPVLGELKKLERLELSHNQISKIEGLNGLENMINLNLSNNQISQTEGLVGLCNLRTLNLSHNQISKIEKLNGLKRLKILYLSHNPISRIENLEGINNLCNISLSNTDIKSIDEIVALSNLNLIDITNTSVSSLEPLKKFKKIGNIRAKNCPIRSLHGITTNPNHLHELLIDPENLSTTGALLYKTAISRHTSLRNFGIPEIINLLEFYHRPVTNLALQYANRSESRPRPLTAHETERIIHEATQKERTILENAVDNKKLPMMTLSFQKLLNASVSTSPAKKTLKFCFKMTFPPLPV